jgi:hypothetical protein
VEARSRCFGSAPAIQIRWAIHQFSLERCAPAILPATRTYISPTGRLAAPILAAPLLRFSGAGSTWSPPRTDAGLRLKSETPPLKKTSRTWQPNFYFKGRATRRLHSYPRRFFSKLLILFGAGFCRDGPDLTILSSFSPLFAGRVSDWVAVAEEMARADWFSFSGKQKDACGSSQVSCDLSVASMSKHNK